MSNNINYEAVFPPAIYNLRMAHSPSRSTTKGSYELYDSKQRTVDGLKVSPAAGGIAPGSPDSAQDFKQIALKLQRELEDSKRKEVEFQQVLSGLKNSHNHTQFLEKQVLDASPSNDSLGENVKDAHIKRLQRQVTVLQANLYKSEGWANRVSDAVKERDKALEDVARLTSDIKGMQEDNHQLLRKIDNLGTALQESQHSLRRVTEELQNQEYNSQLVSKLREEIQRQKTEIKTLKDSVTRLDLENRSLKDPSLDGSCQSLGTMACSQELEHLHKVVDTLKTTVLEQRSYLLNLRHPGNSGTTKSLSSSSAFVMNGDNLARDVPLLRTSPSPKHMSSDVCSAENKMTTMGLPKQLMYGNQNQPVVLKTGVPIDNLVEMNHIGGGEFITNGPVGVRRKLNSQDIVEDSYDVAVPISTSPRATQGGYVGIDTRSGAQIMTCKTGYTYSSASQSSQSHFGQQAFQNMQNIGQTAGNIFSPMKSPQHTNFQHNLLQHEVLTNRSRLEHGNEDQSASIPWQARHWNLASANNSAALAVKGVNDYADAFTPGDPGLTQKPVQGYQITRPSMQVQQETPGQFLLDGNSLQMMLDDNTSVQFENLNLNSTSRAQHGYISSKGGQEDPVTGQDRLLADGGKPVIPNGTAAQEVVYIKTLPGTLSSVDPDPSVARLTSDRLCPVCNKDYSHLSMEDFQSHVFECFDDDASPETMKPQTSPDKLCPMCNASFGHSTSQSEYEKHVHAHFGEEGENFEILRS